MRPSTGLAPVAFLAAALAFALWTWLALGTGAFAAADAASLTPGVDVASPWGQILAAIAVVTVPAVQFVGLGVLAVWAARRRLTNLAWASGLAIPLTFGATQLAKTTFARVRPPISPPLITSEGYAYPSAHMAALTVLVVMVVAGLVLTRQRRLLLVSAVAGLAGVWWFTLYDRWALRAHWFSDLIGGGFLGGTVAALALTLAGVRVGGVRGRPAGRARRPAIVYNPTKIPDPVLFRRHVAGECAAHGWQPPLWLETEPDDPGASATRRALRRSADLIVAAGGDGTVRAVCAAAAASDLPVAILPAGTGNLLARNLGVPLDLADALEVAFTGRARRIDLVEIRADGRAPAVSAVMAGMGTDAAIMGDTNEELKKVVGPAAYVVSAANALTRPRFPATLTADDGRTEHVQASMVLVANVGQLQAQFDLAPDAAPDDGLLDVLIATPRNVGGWAAMATGMLTRSPVAGVQRAQVRGVVVETPEPVPYQLDGDVAGDCRRFEATIVPGAVRVMVP